MIFFGNLCSKHNNISNEYLSNSDTRPKISQNFCLRNPTFLSYWQKEKNIFLLNILPTLWKHNSSLPKKYWRLYEKWFGKTKMKKMLSYITVVWDSWTTLYYSTKKSTIKNKVKYTFNMCSNQYKLLTFIYLN